MLKIDISPNAIKVLAKRQGFKAVYWKITMYEFS